MRKVKPIKVDKLKGMLLDLRLTLLGALEKPPSDTDRKDSVANFLPKLPPSDTDNFLKTQEKSLSTFMEAEEMGTVQPRRCNSCLGCGCCINQAMEHGRKEQAELRLIQKSVKINKELKRVEVSYPAVKDSRHLSDNRAHALGRAKSLNWKEGIL